MRIVGPFRATYDRLTKEVFVEGEDGLIICWCENCRMSKGQQHEHAKRIAQALNSTEAIKPAPRRARKNQRKES